MSTATARQRQPEGLHPTGQGIGTEHPGAGPGTWAGTAL